MNSIKVNVFTENTVEITARLTDFAGDVQSWKNAVYELFRMNMTWDCAYRIEVNENRNGVFVRVVAKPAFEKNIRSFMTNAGFGSLNVSKEQIGIIGCDEVELDYIEVE